MHQEKIKYIVKKKYTSSFKNLSGNYPKKHPNQKKVLS